MERSILPEFNLSLSAHIASNNLPKPLKGFSSTVSASSLGWFLFTTDSPVDVYGLILVLWYSSNPQRRNSATVQCRWDSVFFSRTFQSGECLLSRGLFGFRPSHWRTVALLIAPSSCTTFILMQFCFSFDWASSLFGQYAVVVRDVILSIQTVRGGHWLSPLPNHFDDFIPPSHLVFQSENSI